MNNLFRTEEGKKLCKKVKASPEPIIIKHFKYAIQIVAVTPNVDLLPF